MTDRKNQPAALRRRIELLEGLLEAEKAAHARTVDNFRTALWELVELKQRHRRALAEMNGEHI
jgi:hypothetical protein